MHIRRMRIARMFSALSLGLQLTVYVGIAGKSAIAGDICTAVAEEAAEREQIPPRILIALTRAETARAGQPWPWALNIAGEGHWPESRAEAEHLMETAIARGERSIDVGCFQLNIRWHAQAFSSLTEMFDPLENARYAARFLRDLNVELGSWPAAISAYHSRTPELGEAYLARFYRHYHTVDAGNSAPPRPEATHPPVRPQPAPPLAGRAALITVSGPVSRAPGSLIPIRETEEM